MWLLKRSIGRESLKWVNLEAPRVIRDEGESQRHGRAGPIWRPKGEIADRLPVAKRLGRPHQSSSPNDVIIVRFKMRIQGSVSVDPGAGLARPARIVPQGSSRKDRSCRIEIFIRMSWFRCPESGNVGRVGRGGVGGGETGARWTDRWWRRHAACTARYCIFHRPIDNWKKFKARHKIKNDSGKKGQCMWPRARVCVCLSVCLSVGLGGGGGGGG